MTLFRKTRVVVADPYPVITCGLRKMVDDDPRLEVVAEASTLSSFKKKVVAARPEVALLDWSMALQDLELITTLLRSDLRSTAIVFLTVSENSEQKREMLRLGARAFLSKWCTAASLRKAVFKACQSNLVPGPATVVTDDALPLLPMPDAEQRIEQLTQRERQLIPLVCSGLRNKEIALRLGISESTVWHHLTSVFTKLQLGDRLGLAAFAYSHRELAPALQTRPATASKVLEPFPPHASKSAGLTP